MKNNIINYLEATTKEYSNKIAYVDQNREISFLDLRKEAFCVANQLIKNSISKKPILLFMEKSISLISCFFGVAYSGNFYSPIDTKMPKERIEKIIETLSPVVVITDIEHKEFVKSVVPNCRIYIFEDMILNQKYNEEEILEVSNRVIDTDILYVLFTSGSTGIPKGVIINHRAVIDFVDWIVNAYMFDNTTVFANQAQLYFDLSIQDVYVPIKTGAKTVLIQNKVFSSPTRVWEIMKKNKINAIVWIPSMLSMFANLNVISNVEKIGLKTILFCGEVMPTKQLNSWIKEYPNTVFGNLYGPTECTEVCTYYTINRKFNDDEILPIGIPCENSEAIVVNESGEIITKVGEIGELLIRGTCLSSGYYGDIEKTNEVFIQNPLHKKYKELVYRTGDLVYYNELHELIYVSRKDFQIKIRGYRVELGEIESVVSAIKEISYNCCLFDTKKEKIILLYCGNIEKNKIEEILKNKLQDYMIPSEFIRLEKMVFNINGKIDRKSLSDKYIK